MTTFLNLSGLLQTNLKGFMATPKSNVIFTKGMLQLIDNFSRYPRYVSILVNSTTLLGIGGRYVSMVFELISRNFFLTVLKLQI